MARLYLDFKTNLPEYDPDKLETRICSLIFQKESSYIRVSCCGEEGFGVDSSCYGARWKGVEFSIDDANFDTIVDWTENDAMLQNLLEGAKLIAFYPDEDALEENGLPHDFTVTAEEVEVTVEIGEEMLTFKEASIVPEEELYGTRPEFWKAFAERMMPGSRESLMQALERPHMIEDIKLALTNEDVGDDLLAVTKEGKWLRDYLENRSEKECDAMYDCILEAYYENADLNYSYWRNIKEAAETVVRREWNKQRNEKEETER